MILGVHRVLQSFLTRRADRVIVPSEFLARIVTGWGVPNDRIAVIYNFPSISQGTFDVPIPFSTRFKIVTVGRLVTWKGIDNVIRVVKSIGEDVGLIVVGDGPEEERLRSLAQELGIADRVCFLGRIDQPSVLSVLGTSDVCVLNSTYEGLPHVVLEAMFVGVPVVATAVGGTPELIEDGRTGLLVDPGDKTGLKVAIERLLASEDFRHELGRNAQAIALARFAPRKSLDQTEAVLNTVRLVKSAAHSQVAALSASFTHDGGSFKAQAAILTIMTGSVAFLGLIQGAIVARILGPADYGLAALVVAYPTLIIGLLDARSSDLSIKYLAEFSDAADGFKAGAICLLSLLIDLAVVLVALGFVMATGSWADAYVLQGTNSSSLSTIYAASQLFRVPVGTGYAILIVGAVLQGLGYLIIAFPLAAKSWGALRLGSLSHLRAMHRELGRFVAFSELHALLMTIPRHVDLLLVGALAGTTEAGHFRLGRAFQSAAWIIGGPIQQGAYRRITMLRTQHGLASARHFTRRLAVMLALTLSLPISAALLLTPVLIRWVAGEAFIDGSTSIQILFAATGLWLIGSWVRPWFLATGAINRYTFMFAASLVPYVVVALLATPAIGASGMALGYLLHSLVLLIPLSFAALR
jgi:O-antigen/teichoic acid export membrane protein